MECILIMREMKFSVVIPTCERPGMLRDALHSVADQHSVQTIAEVIVSENSDSTESEVVCNEFAHLPIRYIRQSPPVHPGVHFYRVTETAKSDWVAFLGDDDMWSRYHLTEAHRSLHRNYSAIAFVGQCVIVSNQSREVRTGYAPLICARLQPGNCKSDMVWGVEEVFIESLTRTPLNMWGLVARKDCALSAFQVFKEPVQGLDSDRMMFWKLVQSGPIVVGREVSLFYRMHSSSACRLLQSQNGEFHKEQAYGYTSRMIMEARDLGVEPDAVWAKVWNKLPESDKLEILNCSLSGAMAALQDLLGHASGAWAPKLENKRGPTSALARLKRVVWQVLPPFLSSNIQRVVRRPRQ
jgi:hypothetical protein